MCNLIKNVWNIGLQFRTCISEKIGHKITPSRKTISFSSRLWGVVSGGRGLSRSSQNANENKNGLVSNSENRLCLRVFPVGWRAGERKNLNRTFFISPTNRTIPLSKLSNEFRHRQNVFTYSFGFSLLFVLFPSSRDPFTANHIRRTPYVACPTRKRNTRERRGPFVTNVNT